MIAPREDLHVHSTFSDGAGTIADNVAAATAAGLVRLGCVDHVRTDSDWLPTFVAAVHAAQRDTAIELRIGVEAKLLDQTGTLDVPAVRAGVDRIYAADHQLPLGARCLGPREVRGLLAAGEVTAAAVVTALVDALVGAAARYPRLVIAHLWSALPKVGITEDDVPEPELARLAEALYRHQVEIEIDEQWACPGIATARYLRRGGITILASSDAHRPAAIGRYQHVDAVFAALDA